MPYKSLQASYQRHIFQGSRPNAESQCKEKNGMYSLSRASLLQFFRGSATDCSRACDRRKLNTTEKADYIRAVKCLHEKLPAITTDTVPGASTRFEDFIGVHKLQTPNIHFVVFVTSLLSNTSSGITRIIMHHVLTTIGFKGHFLPWHRYFVAAYENTLRNECGYKGGQP